MLPSPIGVRANTWPPINDRLDAEARARLRDASTATDELSERLAHLDSDFARLAHETPDREAR